MPEPNHALELRRTFRAAPAAVFRHLTETDLLTRWWAPRGWCTPIAEVDLRPGGCFRFGMREESGTELMYAHGVYRVVEAPRRLVYTYVYEPGGAGERWRPVGLIGHETLVTIELSGRAGGTEMFLRHELFPNAAGRDQHREGWGSNFDCLDDFLAGAPPKGTPST